MLSPHAQTEVRRSAPLRYTGCVANPPPFPEELLEAAPSVKVIYLWLLPQGEVSYSIDDVAEALGFTRDTATDALKALRVADLLVDVEAARPRHKGTFYVKTSEADSAT